jgi:hypothetical protein
MVTAITRNDHLINHNPQLSQHYAVDCPYCRLERRQVYGNFQSRKNRTRHNLETQYEMDYFPDILQREYSSSQRNLNDQRVTNHTEGQRETYIEYDSNGDIYGFRVIEPISRGRYIVEHYILTDGHVRNWYLDRLMVLTADQLNSNTRNPQVNESMADVIVYTSLYNINRSTTIKLVTNEEKKKCIICMENLSHNQTIREINKCYHQYHQECFDKWAETNHRCPLCNLDLSE